MDDSSDDIFHRTNPDAIWSAQRDPPRQTISRTQNVASKFELHSTAPSSIRVQLEESQAASALDLQSEAFERGLLLGFSLAQGLPALPLEEEEELPESSTEEKKGLAPCSLKLIGVGGGGGNTLNRVATLDLGVERTNCIEYVAVNTDAQALGSSLGETKIQIGSHARGLGAGGKPHVGEQSALESTAELQAAVAGADMVFVTAGMGGGTGSGAAPVVAHMARCAGALTIGIVTTPFAFEGRVRAEQAEAAIRKFEEHTDILIVVSNDRLLEIVPDDMPLDDAFLMADEIMRMGIIGVADIVIKPGLINVDFADMRSIMQGAGRALMGIGRGFGPDRARDAAIAAVSSPLLDFPISEAKGVIFTITGNREMSLQEVNQVAGTITEMVSEDANIIFGTSIDETFGDEISVTLVATSLPHTARQHSVSEHEAAETAAAAAAAGAFKMR